MAALLAVTKPEHRSELSRGSPRRFTASRIGCLLLLALTMILLAGCSDPPTHPLRLGTNIWPGYEPLYLARDLGYFDAQQVHLVEYPSASEVMRAFRNESLEVAALTLDEALLLRGRQIPIEIFLVTDVSNGADVILGRPGITSIDALKGQRVGVETTAVGALMLSRALDLNGLAVREVHIVNLEISEHESAFRDGLVDAVVTFDPVRTRLLRETDAVELFSSRDIPNEIVDVLVIHSAAAARDPEAVEALVDGWFRALAYLEENPGDASRRLAERLDISPADVLRIYEELVLPGRVQNREMLDETNGTLLQTTERLQDILTDWSLVTRRVDTEGLLTHRFVD